MTEPVARPGDPQRPGRRALLGWLAAAAVPVVGCSPGGGVDVAADGAPSAEPSRRSSPTPEARRSAPSSRTPGSAAASSPAEPSASPTSSVSVTPLPTGGGSPPATLRPSGAAFTVALCGDILLHSGLWAQAARDARGSGQRYTFGPMLSDLSPAVHAADLAIAHLETPVGKPSGPFSSYPSFNVPPQILPALRGAGFHGVSTASNHSLDAGFAGITRTIESLDRAGLQHAGTALDAGHAQRTTMFTVAGTPVALLSFAYGFNGYRLPAGKPWAANLIDVPVMLTAARRAREAGAAVVMVAVHAGTQYLQRPNSQQQQVFSALTASDDVDFVYGHHAHVVQPVSRVNGKMVAYGLGNAVADQPYRGTRDGLLAQVRFVPAGPGRYAVASVSPVPTWMSAGATRRWLDARRTTGRDRATTAALSAASRSVLAAVRSRVPA